VTTILVIGKNGQVGTELPAALRGLGQVTALGRTDMDLTDADAIRTAIRAVKPSIIINAAGYTIVDKAESEPDLAMQVNAVAPGIMAEESKRLGALLVHYSTDYVFDGTKSTPYVENDAPNPVNTYGRTKLEGERAIAMTDCRHLILRTSWIYSATGTNFVLTMLRLGREKKELAIVEDQFGSPTSAKALAQATAALLERYTGSATQNGIFHLSATGYVSRLDFTRKIFAVAQQLSGNTDVWAELRATTTAQYPLPAARPLNAATSKEKVQQVFGVTMESWEAQLAAFLQEVIPRRA
jgi:dTDP-4-dehydrorhamnose reductase